MQKALSANFPSLFLRLSGKGAGNLSVPASLITNHWKTPNFYAIILVR